MARELALVPKALARPGGLARLLSDQRRKILVARLSGGGGELCAMAVGHLEEVGDVCIGVLEWGYVAPEARRLHVAGRMLDVLVDWFVAKGAKGVDAPVLPGDRETKVFLEEAGFKARLITMHRSFGN